MATSNVIKKLSTATAGAALIGLATLFPGTAQAVTLVTSRTALGSNDFVDWGVLGSSYTNVPNPFSITSSGGLNLDVSKSLGSSFGRLDQSTTWWGNFAPGDRLLWSAGDSSPIMIDFATPVFGAGAQIQHNYFGSFAGIIEAFDSKGVNLGRFSLAGNSTSSNDNSAIFIGLLSDSANINKLVFSVDKNGFPQDFAINQLDLVTKGNTQPVPEPLTILGSGLALGFGSLMKKHHSRKLKKTGVAE
jgi:hypothetical protein